MLNVPLYLLIRKFFDNKKSNKNYIKFFFTFIQILLPILIYIIMLKFNNTLLRCYFSIIFSFLIILIGLDYGYFSVIFSSKFFQIIMSCQIEMYLLQLNANYYLNVLLIKNHSPIKLYAEFEFIFKLIIIFIIAFLYKKLLKIKLAMILDKLVSSIIKRI